MSRAFQWYLTRWDSPNIQGDGVVDVFIFLLPDSVVYKISIVHALKALSVCLFMVVLPGHKMAAPTQSNFIFGCRTTEATFRYKRFLSSPNTSGVIGRETRDFFFGCPQFRFYITHSPLFLGVSSFGGLSLPPCWSHSTKL